MTAEIENRTGRRRRRMARLTWLREARLRVPLTLVEVATAASISPSRLSHMERWPDTSEPDDVETVLATIDRLARLRRAA